ncbi:hypothetical protein SLA2020_025640 [Shorea laevis]
MHGGAMPDKQQQPRPPSNGAGTVRKASVYQWYHTLSYRRPWMWLASPFHGDNSTSLYYIFIAMAKFGLMRFTPSQLGRLVGVFFRFQIVHTPAMDKASHCCPSGYGKAIHG